MFRAISVQDSPPILTDDEETESTPNVIGLAWSGSLGVRFLQQEMVLSERSTEHEKFPC
jgi:hypothetical protein